MAQKFDHIRVTISELEKVAGRIERFKANLGVSSSSDAAEQVTALKAAFRRLNINKLVTCKVGLWRKRQPLVDVVVDFGTVQPRTGEEAGEMAALMNRCFELIRQIMGHVTPRINVFCPTSGVVTNGWRFQC